MIASAELKEMTSIKVSRGTLVRLTKMKVHPRQSYEEILIELMKKKKQLKFNHDNVSKKYSTMKVSREIVENLTNLKVHPRQSYEEIVQALLA